MSFPKVVLKYEIPPAPLSPPTSGGAATNISVVSTASAGLAPKIPAAPGEAPHIFLRNDAAWQQISYADLYAVPSHFSPSSHAVTHVIGPDPLPLAGAHNPGFVPPLPLDRTRFFSGSGAYTTIPLVSTSAAGLVPPAPGDASYLLTGTGVWGRSGGMLPSPPQDVTQVLLGTNAWGHLAFSALSGVPTTFAPSAHASSHISGGDLLPLATTAARGLMPSLPGTANLYLRSDNSWNAPAAGDVIGSLGYTPANKAGDTFTGSVAATAGVVLTNTPLYVGAPTVALGGPTLYYGGIQVYNPSGDSGSPSISFSKWNSAHTSTIRAVQIGVDINGVEVSTDLAGPVNIITSSGKLNTASLTNPGNTSQWLRADASWQTIPAYTLANTSAAGLVPSLVTPGSGAGQQTAVWLRGDDTWQPLIGTIAGPTGDTAQVGNIVEWGGGSLPTGWMNCDGSAVSRTTYAALFAQIGTTYGAGDGVTTFNLPSATAIVPLATTSAPGSLNTLSGNVTDYCGGDNNFHALPASSNSLNNMTSTAWTPVTLTISSQHGSITTQSSNCSMLQMGKTIIYNIQITVSNIGSASGVTYILGLVAPLRNMAFYLMETSVNVNGYSALIAAGTTGAGVYTTTGGFAPWTNGMQYVGTVIYETQ